eukprot:8055964-Prorocentrum_lima.AAC.1
MENSVMQIEGLVRARRDAAEQLLGVRIEHDSAAVPWLVKRAAFCYNRFMRDVNGRTPYRKTKGCLLYTSDAADDM